LKIVQQSCWARQAPLKTRVSILLWSSSQAKIPLRITNINHGLDKTVGLHNACVLRDTIEINRRRDRERRDKLVDGRTTFSNLATKSNLKAGKTDQTLPAEAVTILGNKEMVVGYDVSHRCPDPPGSGHSVAGLVASINGSLGQSLGSHSVQRADKTWSWSRTRNG